MGMESVISAFVIRSKKQRYLDLLQSKRGIEKLRRQLSHFRDFDPQFSFKIQPGHQTKAGIAELLADLGAQRCSIFSESYDLDRSDINLSTALERVVGAGLGSILSCTPGTLAYYESEEPGERYILSKP